MTDVQTETADEGNLVGEAKIDDTEHDLVEKGRSGEEDTGEAGEEIPVTEAETENTEQLEEGEENKIEETHLETLPELFLETETKENLKENKPVEEIFMEGVKPDDTVNRVDGEGEMAEKEEEEDHSKRALQETPKMESRISKKPRMERQRFETQRPQIQRLVTPKLVTPRLKTPIMVTPRLKMPIMATPRSKTPIMVTPRLTMPIMATPIWKTQGLVTPKLVTPKLETTRLVTPKLETSSDLFSVRKRLAELTGLGITIVGKQEPVEEKDDAQVGDRVGVEMESTKNKSGGIACANNCGFMSHAKKKSSLGFIMKRHEEKCVSGQRVRNPRF